MHHNRPGYFYLITYSKSNKKEFSKILMVLETTVFVALILKGLIFFYEEAVEFDIQKNVNYLGQQLARGNENHGFGSNPICKSVVENFIKNSSPFIFSK